MRAPPEWEDLFHEWLSGLAPPDQARLRYRFKDLLFRLDGNLYGRRTAGSVYRNELEEILVHKLDPKRFNFIRGQKDPTVFRCDKTGTILIHHVDDIRAAGPEQDLNYLFEVEMPKYCEIQCGQLEKVGTSVEVLGRTKIRTADAVLTLADPKHIEAIMSALNIGPKDRSEVPSKQLDLMHIEPLSEAEAKAYRSAVGSAIYLSAERRDIQFATKELARHMANPRQCDLKAAKVLGAYLNRHPKVYKVIALDAGITAQSELSLDIFTDSDWAGCLETRRSTDCYVVVIGGAVIQCGTQTQPGLPATSSGDAELRGISRGAREGIFIVELATGDFNMKVTKPKLWTDSTSAQATAKRIGPGSKLRHLEVCEFYIQGALQAKKICLGKCKGTYNPANFLTKHAKSGTEVRAALPSLGMLESESLDNFEKIDVKVSQVKPKGAWKPTMPSSIEWAVGNATRIRGVMFASSLCMASAQGSDEPWPSAGNWIIIFLMLMGCFQLATWFWTLVCSLCPDRMVNAEARRLRIPLAEEPQAEPQPEVEIQPLPRRPRGDPIPDPNRHRRQQVDDEGELNVMFSTPNGHRLHPNRGCPTLALTRDEDVRMHFICQVCGAAGHQNQQHAKARAKPKAAPKEVRGRPRRARAAPPRVREAPQEERTPPARDEPPEPEPGQ